MKKLNYILLICVLGLFSCSDSFLNKYPKGEWHDGNYEGNDVNNDLLARGKLQEAYAGLRAWSFAWPAIGMHNISTPDAEKGSTASDGATHIELKNLSFTAANGAINDYYTGTFNIIIKTNEAIVLAQSLPASEEKVRDQIIAECVTLRAAMYFRLTQAFGAVPFIDKVMSQNEKTPGRSSVEEINSSIIADLTWAIPYLSTRTELVASKNVGKVTQNTARAILAKIAIYQKDWTSVLNWTNAIITSGDNNLSTPYDKIFTEAYEYGPESVFEVDADEKPNEKIYNGSQYAQVQGVRGTPNLGWGFNSPSAVLMNAYETGDPRKSATIVANGDVLDGVTVVADANSPNKFFNKKCYTPASERGVYGRAVDAQGLWVNIRLIRYSDIILMFAEAANELNQTDEALSKLEMVRARARGNSSALPVVTERDQDKLREAIHHERRIELAMEFERFFDLVRWGDAQKTIPNFKVGKNELYPIPQQEIDKSNGVLTQNPGY